MNEILGVYRTSKYRSNCCNAKISINGDFGGNGMTLLIRCTKCKGFLKITELKENERSKTKNKHKR